MNEYTEVGQPFLQLLARMGRKARFAANNPVFSLRNRQLSAIIRAD